MASTGKLFGSLLLTLALVSPAATQTPDWMVEGNIMPGGMSMPYNGPPDLLEINTNVDLTNFVGQTLIGMEFTVLPNAGYTYDPGEFEAIFFDDFADTTPDMMPWVPPSIVNLTGETFLLSNNDQTLTFEFTSDPIPPFGVGQFRFQIERPTGQTLFDLQISPIVPEPGTVALMLAGVGLLCRRRRPSDSLL